MHCLPLSVSLVKGANAGYHFMEMGNVLSDREAGQAFASSSASAIGGNRTDNLYAIGCSGEENWTTANPIDGDSVDKVGITVFLPRTDVPRKERQSVLRNSRVSEPSDLNTHVIAQLGGVV